MSIAWTGILRSIQPRIRLTRSFDERSHTYLGYVLILDGTVDNEQRTFSVGIGPAQHMKFHTTTQGWQTLANADLIVRAFLTGQPSSVNDGKKLQQNSH
jgi:hypothetical protein